MRRPIALGEAGKRSPEGAKRAERRRVIVSWRGFWPCGLLGALAAAGAGCAVERAAVGVDQFQPVQPVRPATVSPCEGASKVLMGERALDFDRLGASLRSGGDSSELQVRASRGEARMRDPVPWQASWAGVIVTLSAPPDAMDAAGPIDLHQPGWTWKAGHYGGGCTEGRCKSAYGWLRLTDDRVTLCLMFASAAEPDAPDLVVFADGIPLER